jgi:hypothetical protein
MVAVDTSLKGHSLYSGGKVSAPQMNRSTRGAVLEDEVEFRGKPAATSDLTTSLLSDLLTRVTLVT